MLRFVLVRHAQTAANAARRFAGREDTPLTDSGHAMAAALCEHLAAERFDAVYSSPLQRARLTVEPLARRQGLAVELDDGLMEYDCGGWTGRTRAELAAEAPDAMRRFAEDPAVHAPPGGELAGQVSVRVQAAVERIRAAHPGGARVLVASHKGTLRVLACGWLGIPLRDFRRRVDWSLTGVSVVDWSDDGPMLCRHNDLSHLAGELRDLAADG